MQVEVIVNLVNNWVRDFDWRILSVKLRVEFLLVELYELVLCLLNGLTIFILIILFINVFLSILVLDVVPCLTKQTIIFKFERYSKSF